MMNSKLFPIVTAIVLFLFAFTMIALSPLFPQSRARAADDHNIRTLLAAFQQSRAVITIQGRYDAKESGAGTITDLGSDYVCVAQSDDFKRYAYHTCWAIEAIGNIWYATEAGKQ